MFPSSSSRDPYPYTDQTMFGRGFTNEEHPNSRQFGEPPPSFLHFPTHFLEDNELFLSHLLPQQQLLVPSTAVAETEIDQLAASNKATNINTEVTSNTAAHAEQTPSQVLPNKKERNGATKPIPRKRTGKKDRHSKIYTAQGLRDRRMRLSLQIARKFFDLQDMLGFDKASKTIEWLFTKSKAAIKELGRNLPQMKHSGSSGGKCMSSTSKCEVEAAIKESVNNGDQKKGVLTKGESSVGIPKMNRKSRKAAFHPVARESREKARARARERTVEKMRFRSLEKSKQYCDQASPSKNLEQLRSSSPFDTGEESGSRSQDMNSSLEVVAEVEEPSSHSLEHQMASVGIIEKFLGITSTSTSSSIFNYQHNSDFPGFPGYYDIDNARIHSSYPAMTNMDPSTGNVQEQSPSSIFMTTSNIRLHSQFLASGKPLDANNNQGLC